MPNSKVTGRFVVLHIGCHLSSSKGFAAMGDMALSIGADTFAFFTRNPRGGAAKAADPADAAALMDRCRDRGFARLVAHAPYTMNLCSADAGLREFACTMMKDDLGRMELIPGNYYNFHPGSHTGQGVETGIEFIAAALNQVLPLAEHTTVLLETMAGPQKGGKRTFKVTFPLLKIEFFITIKKLSVMPRNTPLNGLKNSLISIKTSKIFIKH